MNKKVYIITLFAILLLLNSCSKKSLFISDEVDYIPLKGSYGVIQTPVDNGLFNIKIESYPNVEILTVIESNVPLFKPIDGLRVIASYTALEGNNIRLNTIESVISKKTVKQSFINKYYLHISDSLANNQRIILIR